jgi:ribose 5-phosphate isomerase A
MAASSADAAAAALAVARFARPGDVVGVGSGALAAPLLAALVQGCPTARVVAGGDVAAAEAAVAGVPRAPPGAPLDVSFLCADEIDAADLAFVTGRSSGGGSQPQLARLAALAAPPPARGVVALVPHPDRVVPRLAGDIPVLVDLAAWEEAGDALDDLFIGDAEIWRRPRDPADDDAGPRGGSTPHADDDATLLDIVFGDEPLCLDGDAGVSYRAVVDAICAVPGVRATGLAWAAAAVVVGGGADGGPAVLDRGAVVER